ncbi:hypothetical protein [Mumia sp. Pv 4-285]|uniref:hypothetical protein n=1 Tax=Mumia qirimensis TaxID=3234852 RepID=UPI00351D9B1B
MARADEPLKRPDRVIILDANDPMVEIEGRIVWQEEHDRVVEETRLAAYRDGYDAGWRDAAARPVTVEVKRRLSAVGWFWTIVLAVGLLIILIMAAPLLFM